MSTAPWKRTSVEIRQSPEKIVKRAKFDMSTKTQILDSPVKSQSDKKLYRHVQLPNGLRALLIQHFIEDNEDDVDEAEKKSSQQVSQSQTGEDQSESSQDSAASGSDEEEDDVSAKEKLAAVALCVDIGSFSDPLEVQGLSHFLEHMIFMGSRKYPKENDYDKFISENGGSNNAFTECEYTVFHFDIVEEHLTQAMDIFSQLFIAPLLLRDSMEREIEAVESEFKNNLNDDNCRIQQLAASLANGAASAFTWGNSKTLKEGIDSDKLYEIVHDFRKKHYIANKMFLCLESASTLDEMQKLVEEKFNDVQSGEILQPFETPAESFKSEFFEKVYYVKPKSDTHKLFMTFLLPSMEKHYRSKPHDFIGFLIEHEGEGSLMSYLKKKLLALRVEAGNEEHSFEGNSMFSLFSITITLTEEGYEKIDEVLEAIFAYLLLLKTTPFEELEKRFMELKSIKETQFRFVEEKAPSDNVEELVVNMKYYHPLDIIVGADVYTDYDPTMIMEVINRLNEGKFNLLILSNKHNSFPLNEKWFDTAYDIIDFPDTYKNLWTNRKLNNEMSMPAPNEFICSSFELLCEKTDVADLPQTPQKISSNDIYELYYKMDTVFKLPHAVICAYIVSPLTLESTKNQVMTILFSMIAKHYLTEILYPARCAGLGHTIVSEEKGLLVKLVGFNEKLPLLLNIIAKKLKTIGEIVDSRVFDTYKKQYKRNGYNSLINITHFNKDLRVHVVEEHHNLVYDRHREIDNVTFEDFQRFCGDFFKTLRIQMLFQGNLSKEIAMKHTNSAVQQLGCAATSPSFSTESRARKMPVGTNILCVANMQKNDVNSKITNYVQIGASSIRLQCLIEFVESIMEEPIFDILRTKEQLGYSVGCSHRFNNGILGFTVSVQSQETKNPMQKVHEKIEHFLRTVMTETMDNLTDEQFEKHQSALIKLKNIVDHELETEVSRNFSEITSKEYIFNRLQLEAEMFSKLTKREVIEFYKSQIIGADTRNFSVQVIGHNVEVAGDHTTNEEKIAHLKILQPSTPGTPIDDMDKFINSLEMHPIIKTSVN